MTFRRLETPLAGLCVLERSAFADHRGVFRRLFCSEELATLGWDLPACQVNYSLTRSAGSVRGIHFQHPPSAEDKLVACVSGRIWDVAVDLRRNSPTFLQWYAAELTADNGRSLLVPKGFGHGFQALSDDAALVYVTSMAYAAAAEGGLHPADPRVGIAWPRAIGDLSAKDASRPFVDAQFTGVDMDGRPGQESA